LKYPGGSPGQTLGELGAGAAGFLGTGFFATGFFATGFFARVAGLARRGFLAAVLRTLVVFALVFFDFVLRMTSP
jgi:hypothetical protein